MGVEVAIGSAAAIFKVAKSNGHYTALFTLLSLSKAHPWSFKKSFL